jgi:hypothetical protein
MADICIGQNELQNLTGKYGTMTALMHRTSVQGLLNSINHPLLKPWVWRDGDTDLHYVNCIEICNDPGFPENAQANPQAIALWTEYLNRGHRITAIGGSDYHRPVPEPDESRPAQQLGLPSTYVYAAELSGAEILAGLRRGRAYVSVGPRVTFQAQVNGLVYGIGADLGEPGGEITFKATVSSNGPVSASARIVKNGSAIIETPIKEAPVGLQCRDQADPAQPAWYRLDVFDRSGQMLAITNPVFVGPRRRAVW